MYLKVCNVFAPKSFAASSRAISNPYNLEFITNTTNGMQNTAWPIITVNNDLLIFKDEKKDKSEIPNKIPGIDIGMSTIKDMRFLALNLYRIKAKEARTPTRTDTVAVTDATYTLFFTDEIKSSFSKSFTYHLKVKPANGNTPAVELLNEKIIMIITGTTKYNISNTL